MGAHLGMGLGIGRGGTGANSVVGRDEQRSLMDSPDDDSLGLLLVQISLKGRSSVLHSS